MWDNFYDHSVKLNALNDIPFKSTNSSTKKKTCGKEIEFERELIFENDTDFQTFLLPLEQDFTKSSKGYASLLTSISDKEIKSVDCKNESEKSKNILCNDFSETDSVRNSTSSKLFQKYSSYSNDHECTGNHNNLYFQKCALFFHDTLENIESDQTSESKLLKSHTKIIHSTLQNSQNEDNFCDKQESIYTETCIKTICNYSGLSNFSNADTLNDKSDDDDSSESSEIDNFFNGCNNSQNFADDSSSEDSIIFSEAVVKNNKWCSSAELKQTFVTAIDSGSSGYNCHEESKENTSAFFSEDFGFECDSVDFSENPMALERNSSYGSVIAFQSEGYINPSFEDDFLTEKSSFLKSINESWNDSMKNISGEPHESKRVSFVPLSNLVSVFQYEPDDDDYCYSLYVLDQLRFRNRIEEFEHIISPYLTPEHRASIYQRNYLQD